MAKLQSAGRRWLSILILVAVPILAACGSTPTLVARITFTLEVSPGTEVEEGKSVAIVASVEPLEKLELTWSITGTSGGKLNATRGEQVVYTAGVAGTDIVVAEGKTASGQPVKQTVTLTVLAAAGRATNTAAATAIVAPSPAPTTAPTTAPTVEPSDTPPAPTATPVQTTAPSPAPSDTPVAPSATSADTATPRPKPPNTATPPPCDLASLRPPLAGTAQLAGKAEIVSPLPCTKGIAAETSLPVAGTYADLPQGTQLWVLVYAPNLLYYPQSPVACEGLPMEATGGRWQVAAYLGTRGGEPEQFDLVLVVTDAETGQFLGNWVKEGCGRGQYQGISGSMLATKALTEKDSITVETKD